MGLCDSPAGFCDDHFGAQLVEFVPQVFVFEMTVDSRQLLAVTPAFQVLCIRIWAGG